MGIQPTKNHTFAAHAAKAQTKKIWYLKDQETTATTAPKDRPEHPKVVITKDHLRPAKKTRKTRIDQTAKRSEKNTAVALPLNAALFHQAEPIKKALARANLILAGQPAMTTNPKEVMASKPAIKGEKVDPIRAARQQAMTAR